MILRTELKSDRPERRNFFVDFSVRDGFVENDVGTARLGKTARSIYTL